MKQELLGQTIEISESRVQYNKYRKCFTSEAKQAAKRFRADYQNNNRGIVNVIENTPEQIQRAIEPTIDYCIQTLVDHGILTIDQSRFEEMYEDDEFIINLTIDGTEFEEVEVKVTDPNKTIRDQITSIVSVFELPKIDNGGNPIQYLLGQIMDEGEEPEILEFEDEDGREQALIDYNIQPGDHLHLISVPIAG